MSIVSHRRLRHASAARLRPRLLLPITIVSGGQTGADRAALLWAVSRAAPVGGWCPRGRLAEDGQVPGYFPLRETPSASRAQRTAWNVRDADATVLFTPGPRLRGGCLLTARCAARLGRPLLHLHATEARAASKKLARFLLLHRPRVLNVAGSRASE
ncbi:MAG: putative molybdenum carrier protein, partial [Terrimicrobiaceae bacterium]|nr:putative molybdenum carrier protein [Terrimicrobiaceae bacterium]